MLSLRRSSQLEHEREARNTYQTILTETHLLTHMQNAPLSHLPLLHEVPLVVRRL